jgi:hypothetical protein
MARNQDFDKYGIEWANPLFDLGLLLRMPRPYPWAKPCEQAVQQYQKGLWILVNTGFNTSFISINYDIVVTPVCQEFFQNFSKNFHLLDRYQKQGQKPGGESTTGGQRQRFEAGVFRKALFIRGGVIRLGPYSQRDRRDRGRRLFQQLR